MRATYYGAIAEVDDQLGRLFAYLDSSGLTDSTLVVLTSDHGEMGGDHWLFEKLGYWDESFHVPLIVRDPDRSADPGRGGVVEAFTESVDVLPTICRWLGIEVPLQADGFPLHPFITGEGLAGDGSAGALADRGPLELALLQPGHPRGRVVLRTAHGPLLPGRVPWVGGQVRAVRRRRRDSAPDPVRPGRRPRPAPRPGAPG